MTNMTFGTNLIPASDGNYSLGSSENKWNLYANSINDGTPAKLGEIPFARGTGTAAVTTSPYNYTKWEASIPQITSLYDGLIIGYQVPVAGNASYGVCLQVNTLGYHPVLRAVTSTISTRYAVNSTILLMYNSAIAGTVYENSAASTKIQGSWVVVNDVDNNTTLISNLTQTSGDFIAEKAVYRYQLLVHIDEDHLTPFNTTNSGTTTTNKVIFTDVEFNPFKRIYCNYATTAFSANSNISCSTLVYSVTNLDLRYSFNLTTSSLVLNKDVYLKLIPTTGNKAKLASASPITQDLPTTEDGYWYWFLGRSSSGHRMSLYPQHSVYMYKDGTLKEVIPDFISTISNAPLNTIPTPEFVIGTNTSSSTSLTGKLNTTAPIKDGKIIYYFLPYDLPSNNQTLTLTYANSNVTDAIPLYGVNNQRNVIAYSAYSILILAYYNNKFYIINNNYDNGDEVAY